MNQKIRLRRSLRESRREHVASLPDSIRGLLFLRPPSPMTALIADHATIGLYYADGHEAPTLGYATWFFENGHALALPWFKNRTSPMQFRIWTSPFDEQELEMGPFGLFQPPESNPLSVPEVIFVPLLGFTAKGDRLGQGGGHYDRWLEQHPQVIPIGMAWDCQLCDTLPTQKHDRKLRMIVTPSRLIEGSE